MIKKVLLAVSLLALAITLYYNPNFKTIAAGVAILLFGMIMLEDGFRVFTKGTFSKILRKSTDKLYKSVSVGAFITALIQSSSLVSVITISFISAGLISLAAGIGIVFGANIGTTATAWLVSGFGLKIKISALAMPMIIFGLIFSFQKKDTLKGIGNILAGLGFFFLGIYYMKEGFDVFKGHIDLSQYAVSGYLGVFLFTGLGVLITTILQSSSATLALIITALAAGQIGYENALALAIGANVGTTITAILGSLTSNIAGKRLAVAHLIFNIVTGLVAIIFIYQLIGLVDVLADYFGFAEDNYTMKLALFHTIFNFIGVIIMLPFIGKIEKFLIRRLKDKPNKGIDEPQFLNESALAFPDTTITTLLDESRYLYNNAIFEIVSHALNIHRDDIQSDKKLKKIVKKSTKDMKMDVEEVYYKKVKNIYGEIIRYAATTQSKHDLSKKQVEELTNIKVANRKMVEIIKSVRELQKNVSISLNTDNEYLYDQYDKFRKKVIKVLRLIYGLKNEKNAKKYNEKLQKLKSDAKESLSQTNKSIDNLIRKNLITTEMTSSLFNDYNNVNDIVTKLIEVSELLYDDTDVLSSGGTKSITEVDTKYVGLTRDYNSNSSIHDRIKEENKKEEQQRNISNKKNEEIDKKELNAKRKMAKRGNKKDTKGS